MKDLTAPQKAQRKQVLARFEAAAAVESRAKLIDEHQVAGRWLIASLFALNGGAILSLLSSDLASRATFLSSAPAFFVGIIFTFAMVIAGQLSDRAMIAAIHQWGLYWTQIEQDGLRDEDHEKKIKEKIDLAERTGRRGRAFGLFAMGSFMVGCVLSALNL